MRSRWLAPAVVAAMWVFALAVYGRLPAQVPSHWNLSGEIDGWMPRATGAFLPAAIATLVLALLHWAPRLDPRRENVERFQGDWRLMVNLVVLLFVVLEGVVLGSALGWPIDPTRAIPVALALLLVAIGNYLPRTRSNWFIGIRTPWTMDSERVWRATHRVGGRAFVVAGLLLIPAALLPARVRGAAILTVLAVAVAYPLVYSYVAWRRESSGRAL
jgi:uncharacterized membrane protein